MIAFYLLEEAGRKAEVEARMIERELLPGRTAANSGNKEVSVSFFIARCWLSSYTLLAEFLGSIKSIFH